MERLAGILWRLRRVPFFEAAILDARLNPSSSQFYEIGEDEEEMSDAEWRVAVGRALLSDSARGDAFGKLARHEATLMNAFTKTLQMLLLLQVNRAAQETEGVVIEGVTEPTKNH